MAACGPAPKLSQIVRRIYSFLNVRFRRLNTPNQTIRFPPKVAKTRQPGLRLNRD
jgi:hypothetical protein